MNAAGFDYYSWVILPLIIFTSRIGDVTLGTIRHVFMARGLKKLAPLLGFFEVFIWIVVVSAVMKQANNYACYVAWAAGFATGNYIGLMVEEKIALGLQIIRVITNQECGTLIDRLQAANHGTTVLDAHGAKGPVKIILMVVKRKDIETIVKIIRQHNPDSFYSIEDIRDVNRGIFSKNSSSFFRQMFPSEKI